MQSICTFLLWEGACPRSFLKWENFLYEQGSSPKEIACLSQRTSVPSQNLWMVHFHPSPFHAQLGSEGPFQLPLNLIPQSLWNHTINQGNAQSGSTLIIWLWQNLNTTSFGKNFKCSKQQNISWSTRKIKHYGWNLTHTYRKNNSKDRKPFWERKKKKDTSPLTHENRCYCINSSAELFPQQEETPMKKLKWGTKAQQES